MEHDLSGGRLGKCISAPWSTVFGTQLVHLPMASGPQTLDGINVTLKSVCGSVRLDTCDHSSWKTQYDSITFAEMEEWIIQGHAA